MNRVMFFVFFTFFSSNCVAQNTTWQPQPFRLRYKMVKADSAFVLPAYTGASVKFINIDSVGAMWYNTADNKVYIKNNSISTPLVTESNAQVQNLSVNGNLGLSDTTFTVTATAPDNKVTIWVNNVGAATINLPTSAGRRGRIYIIKKISNNTDGVTIDPAGSELVDGNATVTLATVYDFIVIQTNGTNWFQISPAL